MRTKKRLTLVSFLEEVDKHLVKAGLQKISDIEIPTLEYEYLKKKTPLDVAFYIRISRDV